MGRCDVRGQASEQSFEVCELLGGDAAAQPPVERDRGVTLSQDGSLAGLGQLDYVEAAGA